MSKAVLISIQPKWCDLIASGKKTVEVRKTAPKLETPFKCYIYMTKNGNKPIKIIGGVAVETDYKMAGKVIGEFVCDGVDTYKYSTVDGVDIDDDALLETALDWESVNIYAKGRTLYGLHITALKIYNKPKELSEFFVKGECKEEFCTGCKNFHQGEGWLDGSYCDEDSCIEFGIKPLTRPPQSWAYVEKTTF